MPVALDATIALGPIPRVCALRIDERRYYCYSITICYLLIHSRFSIRRFIRHVVYHTHFDAAHAAERIQRDGRDRATNYNGRSNTTADASTMRNMYEQTYMRRMPDAVRTIAGCTTSSPGTSAHYPACALRHHHCARNAGLASERILIIIESTRILSRCTHSCTISTARTSHRTERRIGTSTRCSSGCLS